jgi:hypothetical protein
MSHARRMAFHLRKHYFDLCTTDGRVRIVYAARLRWGPLELGYVGILRDDGRGASTEGSLRAEEPSVSAGGIELRASPLRLELSMQRLERGPRRRLLDGPAGELDWDCHTLRAEVELRDRGELLVGTGYAETLTTTIPPWELPFDALSWGRAHEPERSLVWTVLEGPGAPAPVYAAGSEARDVGTIAAHGVQVSGDERVEFVDQRVLREGAIGETVLAIVPGLERFPGRILGLSETKRYARTPSGGHVIHERVEWPQAKP